MCLNSSWVFTYTLWGLSCLSKWFISMTLQIPINGEYGKKGLDALYHDHMQRQQGLQGVYLAHPHHFALVSDYIVLERDLTVVWG